mmetsp:Transcript_27496/g.26307  ORF Transcript_27496/g.26307 Transcript_27496/m.26307 type:complete len:1010 (+) Transcript_27496:145-3174(+)|eukprot:CAMPEP_0119040124 /NCGR_PEP_ID=MMETSP1177-20130426/9976_1 /TAXON_ID=2985 /ORGANISM="Ochromonas sp, Strain CCMP1899" /LENGTH=1009 /DNA_ID=CAMNT_0007004879 /DNA_START=124 /DNA_END=3153 /DNA_ORIENTATION=-
MATIDLEDISTTVSTMNIDGELTPEQKWPANRVRSTFINYFVEKRGHTFWPSSPVVPVNDPTLLFANSGMNQYKPLFLGTCDPTLDMSKLKMAVNSQKCIRAGGKHNDLDDVGKDVYHHTFFEMLGNWSFGTYFKEEAITWAFECLVDVFGIDPNRLYATYFGGDESQGLVADEEARLIWLRFLPAERILPFGCKDNFWEMGATGPCGPCTEIHYDRIGNRDAAALVNDDRPDCIEIWNNVFIQFNRETDGSLKELPSKHVDTGMGFERLSSILQGKDSNYDTDIFMPIFAAIHANTIDCRPYKGLVGAEDTDLKDMAYRVVADHIRTLTFAITDGAVPSSEGRGYVLRRILRRAVRYGQEILNAPSGFFTKLVPVVVDNFSEMFPELLVKKAFVMSIVAEEEISFGRTLDSGVKHFKKIVATLTESGSKIVPAKDAHTLFAAMGFPLDLTELMAAELGLTVDSQGFQDLMDSDRAISAAAEAARKSGGSKDLTMEAEQTAWLQTNGVQITDSSSKYTWHQKPTAKVVALFQGRGMTTAGFTDEITASDGAIGVILDMTSFYYESGGQIFDTGVLEISDGDKFTVENSQTYAGYVVHVGSFAEGSGSCLKVGDSVSVAVDYERRGFIAPNHTMTHVLNYALKKVLLDENEVTSVVSSIDQKGSLVDTEKLRFDFTWNGSLTAKQVARVESIVNDQISRKIGVFAEVVALNAATEICSLRAVFGEKYPDPVRVIAVGNDVQGLIADPSNPNWNNMSIEFCGGTHLSNTSEAEDFVLIEESGIAKGIRRIVGLTREGARAARERAAVLLDQLSDLEKQPGGPYLLAKSISIKIKVDQAVVSLVDKEAMRGKQLKISEILKVWLKASSAERTAQAGVVAEGLATKAKTDKKVLIISLLEFGADGKIAKKIQDTCRKEHPEGTYFIASLDDEGAKLGLFPIVSPGHVVKGLNAKEWCDCCVAVAVAAGGSGKGGGRVEQAQATITFPEGNSSIQKTIIDEILKAANTYASKFL